MRKLLSAQQVADKLGLSLDWFYRNKNDLVKDGFPPPTFGNRRYARGKWDEKAIDLWLDQKMPAELQHGQSLQIARTVSQDWDATLANRLQEIGA